MKHLLIHELLHGVLALPFAIVIWKNTKSLQKAGLVIAIAYLMDLDHLLDYFLFAGPSFDLWLFLSSEYFALGNRAYVLLHGWEWVAILGILAYREKWKSYFSIMFFALLAHLILDSINVNSFIFYSFFYRLSRGFIF